MLLYWRFFSLRSSADARYVPEIYMHKNNFYFQLNSFCFVLILMTFCSNCQTKFSAHFFPSPCRPLLFSLSLSLWLLVLTVCVCVCVLRARMNKFVDFYVFAAMLFWPFGLFSSQFCRFFFKLASIEMRRHNELVLFSTEFFRRSCLFQFSCVCVFFSTSFTSCNFSDAITVSAVLL